MTERAYLCPIVEGVSYLTGGRSFSAKLPALPEGTSVSCSMPCDAAGVPLYSRALVVVKASDFTALDAFPDAELLNEVPADRSDDGVAALMAQADEHD